MRIPEGILEEIFESIKEENNLEVEKEITHYLSKLKSNLVEIRNAYRKPPVEFDYKGKKNQEVYLIAYFPHYTVPIFEVLEYINEYHPSLNIPQNLCLIGAGPAPEIMGFLKFINNQFKSHEHTFKINIELFDIVSEWGYARKILDNIIRNIFPKLKIYEFEDDVSKNISNSSVLLKRFRKNKYKRVVVIQNIINEIEQQSHEVFIENVIKIYENLIPGSFLILIDLNYSENFNVTYQLETRFKKDVIKSYGRQGDMVNSRTNIYLPEIIENNLFDTPNYGAKRKVIYSYGIFYKQK